MFGATAVDGRADALGGFRGADLDGAHFRLDDLALEVYVEQAALKRGAGDLDPLGQHEAALELTGSDAAVQIDPALIVGRSEEHTSELQSLMRNSYAVFCEKEKRHTAHYTSGHTRTHTRQ